jgi:hypothetical protein
MLSLKAFAFVTRTEHAMHINIPQGDTHPQPLLQRNGPDDAK